jgi:hypothetical protein
MRLVLLLVFLFFFCASNAGADCKSDCEEDYLKAKDECGATYDATGDADERQICLDQAKADYESCLEECKDEWDEDTER